MDERQVAKKVDWADVLFMMGMVGAGLAAFVSVCAGVGKAVGLPLSQEEVAAARAEMEKEVAETEKEREAEREALRIPVKKHGYRSGHGDIFSFSPEPGVTCYTVTRSSQSLAMDCIVKPVAEPKSE